MDSRDVFSSMVPETGLVSIIPFKVSVHVNRGIRSMSGDLEAEALKLIKLRKATQELRENREFLQRLWSNMQNFAQGLRNELDDQYWSENRIAFVDLESTPGHNQFAFSYSELEELLQIAKIKEALDDYRRLSRLKTELETELGVSMDSPMTRTV